MLAVTEVVPTSDVNAAFKDVDVAILVGAMPRREGMERKDLLKANVRIFKQQGEALSQNAKKTCKVVLRAIFCSSHTRTVLDSAWSASSAHLLVMKSVAVILSQRRHIVNTFHI